MSTDSPAPLPAQSGFFKRFLFGLLAIVAIFLGLSKAYHGLAAIFGWGGNPAVAKLLDEADAASAAALKHAEVGDEQYNALIDVVNSDAWKTLREEGATAKASEPLKETAEAFRLAAKKLEEAMTHEISEKLKEFLKLKHDLFLAYADAYDHKRESAELMADTTIATKEELTAKLNGLTEMANVSLTAANEMGVKADAISKELTAK